MNRKDFFRKGLAKAFSVMEEGVNEISETWNSVVEEDKKAEPEKTSPKKSQIKVPKPKTVKSKFKGFRNLQFPPGADITGKRFLSKCTACSDCIYACPYSVLFPVPDDKTGKYFPHMDVNLNACMLCKDYPCISACETGALLPYKKMNLLNSERRKVFSNIVSIPEREKKPARPVRSLALFRMWSNSKETNPAFLKIVSAAVYVFPLVLHFLRQSKYNESTFQTCVFGFSIFIIYFFNCGSNSE